jgi:glutamine synthetase
MANQPVAMLDSLMTVDDAIRTREALAAEGATRLRVAQPDPHGRLRSKEYPLDRIEDLVAGVGYCEAAFVEGLDGEPLMEAEHPGGQGLPDLHAVPDWGTARVLPWEPDTAIILADLETPGHAPSGLCTRDAVRRQAARLAEHGLVARLAAEYEFYLLRPRPDGGRDRYSPLPGYAYTTGRRADPDGSARRMHDAAIALGIEATTFHREVSPGQFEINLHHAEPLEACDRALLLEETVKEVAALEGLQANFMPKPFADAEGSGLHLHLSLWRDGESAFAQDGGGLSPLGRDAAMGLAHHAPALSAIASPTINSYKRLGGAGVGLTPLRAELGGDDRTAYLRVPPAGGGATRIEFRAGDAAASPHLLAAVALAAMLDGVERGLGSAPAPDAELPRDLETALRALEADEVIAGALGPALVSAHCAVKRRELLRFSQAITEWEWSEYADHV